MEAGICPQVKGVAFNLDTNKIKEIYLDNAATTRAYPEVAKLVSEIMLQDYGNTSSLHMKGVSAENRVKDASKRLASIMKVAPGEILYTSGGTESNNLALIGAAKAYQRSGKHILVSSIEHPSVYNPVIALENEGFEVEFIPVDRDGIINVSALTAAIREDTILVSVMAVNNEIGSIQPLEEVVKAVKGKGSFSLSGEKKPQLPLIHADGVQTFGKMNIYPDRLGIDLFSASAHKFHGPKGVGFLWARRGIKLLPIEYGGGHQGGLRPGTVNTPGIAGMALAASMEYENIEEKREGLYSLRSHFIERLEALEGVSIKCRDKAAPHIVSASFDGVRAEVLLHSLEERNIYVSSGSACSSNHPGISGTLKAIGVKKNLLDSTIRFSFSFDTSKEELDICADALEGLLPMLRRFTRH